MNTTVNDLYAEYLKYTSGNRAAAASLTLASMMAESRTYGNEATAAILTLADVMQRMLDTGRAEPLQSTKPLTVPEVAKFLRVAPTKVLTWIRNGRLRGYNVAEKETGRPKYRINPKDLEFFTKLRVPCQPVAKGRPVGRHRLPPGRWCPRPGTT